MISGLRVLFLNSMWDGFLNFLKGHWPVSLLAELSHLSKLCCRISRIPRFTDFLDSSLGLHHWIHWTSARNSFLLTGTQLHIPVLSTFLPLTSLERHNQNPKAIFRHNIPAPISVPKRKSPSSQSRPFLERGFLELLNRSKGNLRGQRIVSCNSNKWQVKLIL